MSKSHKPNQKAPTTWEMLEDTRIATATTLLINLKSIKGLIETDGFDDVASTETFANTIKVLGELSNTYTEQLHATALLHKGKQGVVTVDDIHTFMFISQKYADLTQDILASVVGLTRVLVNLKDQLTSLPTDTVH